MALVIYWYDFICFAIVAAAMAASLWVLWRHGDSRGVESPALESLLESEQESDVQSKQTRQHLARVGSSRLWTSCWRGVHPGWLLLTRSVSFLVLSALLAWDIIEWGPIISLYYTEWTLVLIIIYFTLGIVASTYGCCKYSKEIPEFSTENSMDLTLWDYLIQTIYHTCAGAVALTDVVFWAIIVPFLSNSRLRLNLLMGVMHTANAFFLLVDTVLNNLPFTWFRIAYFVQWSCLYVVFQWVVHACGLTWWPYPFLELDKPSAPIWYLCMAAVHIPCYGVYAAIVKAKNSILLRLFPRHM